MARARPAIREALDLLDEGQNDAAIAKISDACSMVPDGSALRRVCEVVRRSIVEFTGGGGGQDALDTALAIAAAAPTAPTAPTAAEANGGNGDNDDEKKSNKDQQPTWGPREETMYCACLKDQAFGARDMVAASSSSSSSSSSSYSSSMPMQRHGFEGAMVQDKNTVAKSRQKRIAREVRVLKNMLPLASGASIFLRVDTNRPYLMQALVTGPPGTPYEDGCFQFDVYAGPDYPKKPPKVHIMTTGGGVQRFNPNLYANGKVCLSLLGTWAGHNPTQNWTRQSTILQVLLSIQSLIMGHRFPYFNEPGREREFTAAAASAAAAAAAASSSAAAAAAAGGAGAGGGSNGGGGGRGNRDDGGLSSLDPATQRRARTDANGGYEGLRVATIRYAMVGQLRRPSDGFESAIRRHFYCKRAATLRTVRGWLREAEDLYGDMGNRAAQQAAEAAEAVAAAAAAAAAAVAAAAKQTAVVRVAEQGSLADLRKQHDESWKKRASAAEAAKAEAAKAEQSVNAGGTAGGVAHVPIGEEEGPYGTLGAGGGTAVTAAAFSGFSGGSAGNYGGSTGYDAALHADRSRLGGHIAELKRQIRDLEAEFAKLEADPPPACLELEGAAAAKQGQRRQQSRKEGDKQEDGEGGEDQEDIRDDGQGQGGRRRRRRQDDIAGGGGAGSSSEVAAESSVSAPEERKLLRELLKETWAPPGAAGAQWRLEELQAKESRGGRRGGAGRQGRRPKDKASCSIQ